MLAPATSLTCLRPFSAPIKTVSTTANTTTNEAVTNTGQYFASNSSHELNREAFDRTTRATNAAQARTDQTAVAHS